MANYVPFCCIDHFKPFYLLSPILSLYCNYISSGLLLSHCFRRSTARGLSLFEGFFGRNISACIPYGLYLGELEVSEILSEISWSLIKLWK